MHHICTSHAETIDVKSQCVISIAHVGQPYEVLTYIRYE